MNMLSFKNLVTLLFGFFLAEGSGLSPLSLLREEVTNDFMKDKCGHWFDKSDANAFFECEGEDNIVKRLCPPNTVFNNHIQKCVQSRSFIKTDEPQLDYSPTCLESQLHNLWPHPEVPEDYFICTSIGVYERLTCPHGSVFVFLMQMCVETATTTTTEAPIDRSPDCTINDLHLTWPDPIYPEVFYICTGIGQSEERRCPDGLVFVFMLQMCVESEETTTRPSEPETSQQTMPEEDTTMITEETTENETTYTSTDETTLEETTLGTTEPSTITQSTETPETTTEGLQTAPTIAHAGETFH